MYRAVVVKANGQMVSQNGTKDEVETFILEQGDIKKVRTMNKETGDLVSDLTYEA